MNVHHALDRLEELDACGQGETAEAVFLRDQLHAATRQAFMTAIAPEFQRADGSYPEWITKHETPLPSWVSE